MKLPTRTHYIILYLVFVIAIGFLILTVFVVIDPVSVIDREFSQEIQEHKNHFLDVTMKLVSWFGYMPVSPVLILTTAFIFYISKYKREALFVVFTVVSGLVSSIMKLMVGRPRPLPSIVRVIEKTREQSFPSGHVIFYVVFFGFLTLLMYRLIAIPKYIRISLSAISMLFIFTVPVSRIYLGAHWFTDVLGGLLSGLLCLYVLGYFYLKNSMYHPIKS